MNEINLPPAAVNRFEWTWEQFIKALESNPRLSLCAFCRSVHTSYKGMSTWMVRHGHTVGEVKQVYRESVLPGTPGFACIVPSGKPEAPAEPFLYGISITFNSGTTVSIRQGSASGVLKLISIYEGKEGEPCIH